MREIRYREALREAMLEEMERDERVIFYGEDVADYGGAFKASKGLFERFGRDRVFNTPISEAAIIGTGVGAAKPPHGCRSAIFFRKRPGSPRVW